MANWVWITCAAALAQTLRFILQKHLARTGLTATGATFARFVFAAPVVLFCVWIYAGASGQALEMPATARFWAFALTGALAQIFATILVITLFSMRNFAVGITLKKTEVLQTALVGFVLLGELVTPLGLFGILIGFLAVLLLSDPGRGGVAFGFDRTAAMGLLSGAIFGISGVAYRGATLSMGSGDVALRAALTLACVTAMQSVIMGLWFAVRDPGQIGKVVRGWRITGLVGLASMVGSFCWFSAFTLQQAAYVNAVGQVELVFSILASTLIFGERISGREGLGMGLLAVSIVVVVLGI